ncbi:hypothetical protein AU184_00675 [Mycolicibacterium novocastrense]|uniref:hypothetical protein n=1 Tax=Mycolicibacterium novocastrense TaxID=59813 RepID=UPI00074B07E7|nr:hypothetical protein [Mycolicibacterium novocastrense]KUH66336.1 hypothetical protein AU184_00675 [Mycolicibacterium novocastrense]KUH72689.1 hypothetical protein AU072_19130 [Mycolicibacterium novocastrense]KUH75012.1 hypothetical protein AU183_06950 [Mycolicibacterium novocastrense]
MKPTLIRSGAICFAATLLVAGCGGSRDTEPEASSPAQSTVGAADMPDQQRPPDRLTIDVTIEGGNVEPTNAQIQGKVGEPIVLRVNSDAADELHVHSVPEHTFKVDPTPGQQFQFTVDVPGNVEIELHDLNRVIATVQVQQ